MILEAVKEANQLAKDLRQAYHQAASRFQWLVLADNDPTLLRRLEDLLGSEALLVPLDVAAELDEPGMAAEFEELLRGEAGVPLVLVGHSGASEVAWLNPSTGTRPAAEGQESTEPAFRRWVSGAERMQQQLQAAKQDFSERVLRFVQRLGSADLDSPVAGQVQALFYHAQAGLFLQFDWESQEFRQLIEV